MFSPTLEDACHLVDILERVLSEEIKVLKCAEDPLEACLEGIFEGMLVGCPKDHRDIYGKLLKVCQHM